MATKLISTEELKNILANIKGATMVTVTAVTEPNMKKTNNPYLGVKKITTMNCTINFIYANSVNNQRAKEGSTTDFTPYPRKWGHRIQGTPLIEHKGEYYLEVKPNGKPQDVTYSLNGTIIPVETLKPFLYENKSNAAHQGVDKEIIVRDIKLSNISQIQMKGDLLLIK
jgi:hypothetical protein